MVEAAPSAQMQDLNSQAFWNEFMRRPDAKAAYQAERQLQGKKMAWLQARDEIDERGRQRQVLAQELERNVPADLKKLITPMFHLRIVQQFLWMVFDECQKSKPVDGLLGGMSFCEKLRDDRTMAHLQKLRENFQVGGEDRMEKLENQWHDLCNTIYQDEEAKKEQKPVSIDVHTLKHVLEFAQECKREGNNKFKEGLYEEALYIYSQGDDCMKKWKVDKHLKNESQWLHDYHIACLKNKSQAALKLELYNTALEAAEAAIELDSQDHKAWYRKVQSLKCLGRFAEAIGGLVELEKIAENCFDRRQILRDCEAERKKIQVAEHKHKHNTREMLGKAFDAEVFSGGREQELEHSQRELQRLEEERFQRLKGPEDEERERKRKVTCMTPLERNISLTVALAGELIDELADAYSEQAFQERVAKCARDSGYDKRLFMLRLKDLALQIQKPILQKWGFEGDDGGIREMTAAIRDLSSNGRVMPAWFEEKRLRCLKLLYGGEDAGMLDLVM